MFYVESIYSDIRLRENAERISEHIIQGLWNYLFLRMDDLTTVDGHKIRILDKGRWHSGSGPDFRQATLRIGDTILCGDVEIHWQTTDWLKHGHERDPAYFRVILHVVYRHDKDLHQGAPYTLEIKDRLSDTLKTLTEKVMLLDSDQDALFCSDFVPSIEPEFVTQWVQENGAHRLRRKTEQLKNLQKEKQWTDEQLLYYVLCDAMGFTKNRLPFCMLAERVPYDVVYASANGVDSSVALMRVQALLIGAAGLLPDEATMSADPKLWPYAGRLWDLWSALSSQHQITPLHAEVWIRDRLRPKNYPLPRMAALAGLLVTHLKDGLSVAVIRLFSQCDTPPVILKNLHRILKVRAYGYWGEHVWWNVQTGRPYSDLIGKQRAYEIIINAIVPYVTLYAQRLGDKKLYETVMTCMKTWVAHEHNHIIGWMEKRLPGMPDRINAEYAQGLIELHKKCRVRNCSDCRIFQRMVYSDFI